MKRKLSVLFISVLLVIGVVSSSAWSQDAEPKPKVLPAQEQKTAQPSVQTQTPKQEDIRYTDENLFVPMDDLVDEEGIKKHPLESWGAYREVFHRGYGPAGQEVLRDD